ncbi:hypothetical protein [Wolbachia endosymbiont of Tetranychus urticae]|uniref:hypothetical protein n=1 Tax=Wolbachia endosymbiont of Tetranychus urticae TaxID=169184 RepID=UPI00397B8993
MNQIVEDDCKEIVDLNNNNDDLDKIQSISNVALEEEEEFFDAMEDVSNVEEGNDLGVVTSEEREFISDLEEVEEFFDSKAAAFDIPLSIFHYKDYNSDFFTSWYNISSEIFREINRACPEKKVLNLALSVLVLPYIVFTAMGLVIYSRFKADSKTQADVGEDKTKKGETSVPKRLAYGALAAMAIFVNVTVLLALIVPATVALATFYLLDRDLSHSLVTALKISMGRYSNKHQNIEVSFHEKGNPGPNIAWDMEIKFPPQFKRLLRDLCENENNQWFSVTRDSKHNIVLKLSTNINLKNGLKPLRNEIKDILATSIQGCARTMEELVKLEKKEITYDKLKELLSEFRLKVVSSIDFKLTTHLIENAYQVAFIQAIKFQQNRRGEDFSLEDELKNTLVRQELESQGKELSDEKEVIIRDLKEVGARVPGILDDSELPVFKAEWERLKEEGKIAERAIIDVYEDIYPQETKKALDNTKREIECLKKEGQERYIRIHKKLKAIYDEGKNNLTDDDLKRKLEGLFKFEYGDQKVERRLIKSVMKKAKGELDRLVMLSLIDQFQSLEKKIKHHSSKKSLKEALDEVNDFIAKMYLEITKRKTQDLFKSQAKGIENSCKLLEEKEPDLVQRINVHRVKIAECLDQPISLREVIEESEDLNKYLEDERKRKGEEHPSTKLIEKHLQNNQEILKALKQLELEKEGLLINKKTKNDYREELESREKIKFAIIEDDLLKAFKHETFDEEEIKKLLEEAELEYYLAEKCIKTPIIKIKNNIKHFCQDLLSSLVERLANLIINNVPKDNESGLWRIWNSLKVGFNYNVIGWSATVNKDNSTEGKALSVAHDTHKEVETFLQCLKSSYEEFGALLGNLFSDDGETFKNDVWPKVEEHLHGMWDRFFKDIEFKIGNKLDEVTVTQQNQETAITS